MSLVESTRAIDEKISSQAIAALGPKIDAALFLDRCQIDTPERIVREVWKLVRRRRKNSLEMVADFGAGDGRFARFGRYEKYIGYEIDPLRIKQIDLPSSATIVNACAFSGGIANASLCIGNPPFVRNQDLPSGWRERAASLIQEKTGIKISGLANAWQYFFFLSLASSVSDGLVALVIPYEWVSRSSAKVLREYVKRNGWAVDVYRLNDETFDRVLTTSSITIVDKRSKKGCWRYFEENDKNSFFETFSPTGKKQGLLPHQRPNKGSPLAKRGLSPGTQKVFTLTESERARLGLRVGRDVIPCVTTLRNLSDEISDLNDATFTSKFIDANQRCWLVRTDKEPSTVLKAYFESVDEDLRNTATCLNREIWWKFTMPAAPDLLIATGFRTKPKVLRNKVGAVAVGGVAGIYGIAKMKQRQFVDKLRALSYENKVVPHANGLRKLEINQLNALLNRIAKS